MVNITMEIKIKKLIEFTKSLIDCYWDYEDAIKEFEIITGEDLGD